MHGFLRGAAVATAAASIATALVMCSNDAPPTPCNEATYAADACDPTSLCDVASKCPNDTPLSETERQTCIDRIDDPCGRLYGAYLACYQANQICTAGGTTDPSLTNGTCGDAMGQWQACYYSG